MNGLRQIEQDEDTAPEWERIKNFVGGANKQSKHPLTQEMERMKARSPQHMDEGGMAGDPGMASGMPPADLAASIPPAPVPGSPAPGSAPTDEAYEGKASSILGGVTPEKIAQLMETLNQQSNRGQIGAGIAGLGDAIASVGGQNPGHMQAAEQAIQRNRENQLKIPEMMAAVGKERHGLAQELQAKDPASPFSKVTQNANRQLLKQMGASDADINTMPATAINDVVGHQVTLQDALARIRQEGSYQQGMLENTRMGLQQSGENQKLQREEEGTRIKTDAAKALAGRGFFKSLLDTVPGTSGHSAKKVLEETAGLRQPGYIRTSTNPETGQKAGTRDGKTWELIQ